MKAGGVAGEQREGWAAGLAWETPVWETPDPDCVWGVVRLVSGDRVPGLALLAAAPRDILSSLCASLPAAVGGRVGGLRPSQGLWVCVAWARRSPSSWLGPGH